jgi:hypothetical protein
MSNFVMSRLVEFHPALVLDACYLCSVPYVLPYILETSGQESYSERLKRLKRERLRKRILFSTGFFERQHESKGSLQ